MTPFFYSGHGAQFTDPGDPNAALGFLVLYDATRDIVNSCPSVDDLKRICDALRSRANHIFVDSCFSGSVAKNGKGYPQAGTKTFKTLKSFANTVLGKGTITFTASKDDELALEDPDYLHGLFTHHRAPRFVPRTLR
jgi:Caspase domain